MTQPELEVRLRDLAAGARELALEHEALAWRCLAYHDELERLADHLYAEGQDLAVLLGLED